MSSTSVSFSLAILSNGTTNNSCCFTVIVVANFYPTLRGTNQVNVLKYQATTIPSVPTTLNPSICQTGFQCLAGWQIVGLSGLCSCYLTPSLSSIANYTDAAIYCLSQSQGSNLMVWNDHLLFIIVLALLTLKRLNFIKKSQFWLTLGRFNNATTIVYIVEFINDVLKLINK